jgi:hypothetical protein
VVSNIDPSLPVYGTPLTESVRDNFATAKAEIEALQEVVIATPVIGSGTLTLDAAVAGVFRTTLNSNILVINLNNAPAGKITTRQLELVGDGTARTINFGAWTLATGTPVPTSTVGRKDVYDIRTDGNTVLVWLIAQNVPA